MKMTRLALAAIAAAALSACSATTRSDRSQAAAPGPLETAITSGPGSTTASRDATFWFAGVSAASFRCRLDDAAPEPCASPVSYAALADGPHAFEVTGHDAGGQPDPTPARYAWTVDATPPEVTVTSAPPTFTPDPLASVAFVATEARARVTCSLDHAAPTPCSSPWRAGPLADGPHELAISAADAAGNRDPSPARVSFTVDTRRPTTLLDLSPASPAPASAAVAFHADEPGTFRCAVDGAPAVACTSPFSLSGLSDGAHRLSVTAVDLAGNVDASPPVLDFTVDGRTPDTLAAGPSGVAVVRTATITFTSTLDGAAFRCALDGATPAPCSSPLVLAGLADGAHRVTVAAVSATGNADATPALVAWVVDATPPDTAFTRTPAEVTTADSARFEFTTAEPDATFLCALDAATPAPCTSPLTAAGLPAGMHALRVAAVDAAGNQDPTPATFFWTIQGPALLDTVITGGPPSPTRDAAVAIHFDGRGGIGFECALDGAARAPCTSPFRAAGLVEGDHTFAVAAVTATGVLDASPATLAWTIDLTPPVAQIAPRSSRLAQASAVATFDLTSSEAGSAFQCAVDGGPLAPCPATFVTPSLADGPHVVEVIAVDLAGNRSDLTGERWVVDTVAPDAVLVSTGVESAAGRAGVIVALSEPGTLEWTLDAVALSSLCQDLPGPSWTPGDVHSVVCAGLADGTHTLAVTGVDPAGNRAPAPVTFTFAVDLAPGITFSDEPAAVTSVTEARFAFTVSKPASVTCAVDGATPTPCTSPLVLGQLGDGSHTLDVAATSGTGVVGHGIRSWRVDTVPPDTFLYPGPPTLTSGRTAHFSLNATEAPVTFRCTLDGASLPCSMYTSLSDLSEGAHTFAAAAVDAAGLVDPTPAVFTWTVDLTPPAEPAFAVTSDGDSLTVSWTAPADAASFEITVAERPDLTAARTFGASASPVRVTGSWPAYLTVAACRDYWVTVVAVDAAGNRSTRPAARREYNAPRPPADFTVAGQDGVIVLAPAATTHGYQVAYGATPDATGGSDAAEGPSPVTLAAGAGLHGFPADAVRWFRVASRYGDGCVSDYAPAQRATPYPWRAVSTGPVTGSLASVACPGGGPACVAVGVFGEALATADGITWTRQNGGTGKHFLQAVMPTASTGFAVAQDGELFRTTNGGATWLHRGVVGSSWSIARLAFASPQVGYVATGSGLHATADGGATWTQALGGSWADVHAFPGTLRAVAVGAAGAIRTTADGGATWATPAPAAGALHSVTCPTAQRCFAAGVYGLVLVSDDGGDHWTPRPSGIGPDIRALSFADANQGWARDVTGVFHRTEDAGLHWAPLSSTGLAGATALTATGPAEAWAFGARGLLARTVDGGTTWTPAGPAREVAGAAAVDVLGATTIVVAGSSASYRSGDGGSSWVATTFPSSTALVQTPLPMSFADARFGLLARWSSFVRTTDGGGSWSLVSSPSTWTIDDLFCLPRASPTATPICFAATYGGLYRSDDGGTTWATSKLPGGVSANSVRFLDSSRGFAATSNALFATADGGASWWLARTGWYTLAVVPPSTVIFGPAVSFDAGVNWTTLPFQGRLAGADVVVGMAGTTYGTPTAYGACTLAPGLPNCRTFFFPSGASIVDLAFVDADTWYAVDGERVWKTTTAGR